MGMQLADEADCLLRCFYDRASDEIRGLHHGLHLVGEVGSSSEKPSKYGFRSSAPRGNREELR